MLSHAKLVIIGAGIVGCSAAYHLTKMGWRDIVVLDQGPLFETGGSTSHAPGLVFQTNASPMMTKFAKQTVELLTHLHSDQRPTFYPVGSIEVAYTPERLTDLKRKHGYAQAYGLESAVIAPEEVAARIPILDPAVIHGGFWAPADGDAKSVNACEALAQAAEQTGGAHFFGNVRVTDVETRHGQVTAIHYAGPDESGMIHCEQVLLCTNIWSPVLARMLGVTIPLMAVEHLYAITTPVPGLEGTNVELLHPILRHQDHAMYFRQHFDRYGIGSYNHAPLLVEPKDVGRIAMRPFTPDHFRVAWASTHELLPPTRETQIDTGFNGMFAFTTDGFPVLGEAPGVRGFWIAAGIWVTHSGGGGRAIAEWMTDGQPGIDLHEADIARFHPHVFSQHYIRARCATQYDEVYDIIHPQQQLENPRNLRLSPIHVRLQEQGAVFFESAGWERPQWLESNVCLLEAYQDRIPQRQGWEARFWSPIQGAEHLATRERVALYDLAAFTKIEVSGPGALAFLESLAANKIDRPVGKIIYTALLDRNGGIMADLTITRLGPDRFWVLTGGGVGPRDLAWLRCHAPKDNSVTIRDISTQFTTIGLWGPRAREVLQSVCETDVSNHAFPYFTAQPVTVDVVPCTALRVSYVGELGWEIYAPTEYALRLWHVLRQAGQPHGMIVGGNGAFDSLRLEKGYRLWGQDIHNDYNPFEAGIDWAVRLDKGNFMGHDALCKIKEEGIQKKLCCLVFKEQTGIALGKEPILHGSRVLGYVTSANYGYSVGKFILYGYLPTQYAVPGTNVEVEYFGKRYPAVVVEEPLYDAGMQKLRA